jgi:hypothetical protein
MTRDEIEMALLKVLGSPIEPDKRLGQGKWYLIQRLNQETAANPPVTSIQFMQAVWALTANGLCFIDFTQPSSDNWTLELTDAGREALNDQDYIPDNVPAYLRKIAADVPDLSPTANLYLVESIQCYTARNYLAATIMLGVAAEAVFYESAEAFSKWVPGAAGANLAKLLAEPKISYIRKFTEFRDRLLPQKNAIPADLGQTLDLDMNATLDLLRRVRNDVGHPSGLKVDRQSILGYLVVFPALAKRLYELRKFCLANLPP